MLEKLYYVMVVIFIIYLVVCLITYMPRMRGWFASFKKQEKLVSKKQNKMAICIPARNESSVIVDLLKSIQKQTYSADNFDVYIMVQDPNDPTVELAKMVNATVYVVTDQTCKGDTIDYCFQDILKKYPNKYEGLIIVDADCIISETFMEEMNNSFASGRDVFQAKKNVKNYLSNDKKANSLVSSCNGIIWTLIDDMGNRYKSDINVTNMTIGTGIMIRTSLIKKLKGWPYRQTSTEDIEFMYDCAIHGVETYYNSHCIMYVEESTSLHVTNQRRWRWLKGVIDSDRIYRDRLDKVEGKKNRKNRYYTVALWPVFHYIAALVLFAFINIVLFIPLVSNGISFWYVPMCFGLGAIGVIYLSFWFMTLIALIVDRKNIKLPWYKRLAVLFVHPLFYMGYIRIVARAMLTKPGMKWDAIKRVEFNVSEAEFEKSEN